MHIQILNSNIPINSPPNSNRIHIKLTESNHHSEQIQDKNEVHTLQNLVNIEEDVAEEDWRKIIVKII